MLTTRANCHHSKLPKLGAIVRLPGLVNRDASYGHRWIVVSFGLLDGADRRYCRGIHLATIAKLGDSHVTRTVAGHWCEEN